MTDIDAKILEAMQAETEETLQDYSKDLNIFELIVESFKGAFKWTVIFSFFLQLVFFAAVVYCTINLFSMDDIATKLNWLAMGLAAFIAFGLLRLWFLMELNRLSVRRDIKRLELQLALLSNELRLRERSEDTH